MFDDIDVESEQIRKELEEAEGTRERVIDPVFASNVPEWKLSMRHSSRKSRFE